MSYRTYSDEQLASAVTAAHSWRGVLREVGLSATSAGSARSVRRRADHLGLDYSHFTGQRRWTDRQLAHAVRDSLCWADVVDHLGLAAHGNNVSAVRAHTLRMGIDTSHFLDDAPARPHSAAVSELNPHVSNLRSAGPCLAASWFLLRGAVVSWPLEPCRYDLIAQFDATFLRVQVKTTTYGDGATNFATVSSSGDNGRAHYTEDEIDCFFIINTDLDAYVIPVGLICGRQTVSLSAYPHCLVARRGQWLTKLQQSGAA